MTEFTNWNERPVVTLRWWPFWIAVAVTWGAIAGIVSLLARIGW